MYLDFFKKNFVQNDTIDDKPVELYNTNFMFVLQGVDRAILFDYGTYNTLDLKKYIDWFIDVYKSENSTLQYSVNRYNDNFSIQRAYYYKSPNGAFGKTTLIVNKDEDQSTFKIKTNFKKFKI